MSKKTRFYGTIILLLAGVVSVAGQIPANADPSARSVVAMHADKVPELDGTLEDAAWQDASLISSFRQREPFERQPATEKTEVKVLYDSRFLYFGIHCFDSQSVVLAIVVNS